MLNCPGPTHATAAELARSRGANEWVELALLEASGAFMANEADALRAERESAFFWEFRDAGIGVGFLPDYVPELIVSFDAIGAAAVRAGTYTAWDCLNRIYGGVVSGSGSDVRVVSFRPLNLETLGRDYAQLPNVRYAYPNHVGVIAACGYSNDLCVEPDPSGRWTWLAQVDGRDCGRTFYRLTTEADGGRTIEQWDAGEPSPFAWFDQAPQCAMNLWGNPWRYPDGGIVIWTRDGGR